MKNDRKIFNYILSIGFILLIVLFLISLIGISRSVLSGSLIVKEHVHNTQNLLQDISEVEKSVEENTKTEDTAQITSENIKTSNFKNNILDASYTNINENKSVITFILNSEISQENNTYYLKYKNQTEIEKNDIILYYDKDEFKTGKITTIAEQSLKVININTMHMEEITTTNILGKIITEK